MILLLNDYFLRRSLELVVHHRYQLVKQLGNRLLINMIKEPFNDVRVFSEDVRNEHLLLSLDQERYQLCEVTTEDGI